MKKQLLTLLVLPAMLIASCSKSESDVTTDVKSSFNISVKKNYKLSTGEVMHGSATVGILNVWKIDNKNIVIDNTSDAISGFALDQDTKKSVSADYTTSSANFQSECEPGKYLVFVILSQYAADGKLAHSDTTFVVNKGENAIVSKNFNSYSSSVGRQNWSDDK